MRRTEEESKGRGKKKKECKHGRRDEGRKVMR